MRQPRHIAIVMDGNGRWAQARRRPRAFGHRAGQKAVRATIEYALRRGIEALTLFAFSSENWQRPPTEVSALMELFLSSTARSTGTAIGIHSSASYGVRALRERIRGAMAKAHGNTKP